MTPAEKRAAKAEERLKRVAALAVGEFETMERDGFVWLRLDRPTLDALAAVRHYARAVQAAAKKGKRGRTATAAASTKPRR